MLSLLKRLWPAVPPHREAARTLYRKAVAKARDPAFYADMGVPDTVDGRFDMIVLHTSLTVRRLRTAGQGSEPWHVAQEMFDHMFSDFDRSLRELGVGDLSVSKHIKKMGKAWYARAAAAERGIDAALAGDPDTLCAVLRETVFRARTENPGVSPMANYLQRAAKHLSGQDVEAVARGDIDWNIVAREVAL